MQNFYKTPIPMPALDASARPARPDGSTDQNPEFSHDGGVAMHPATIGYCELSVSAALAGLLQVVAASGYRFITVTPVTHRRILAHRARQPGETMRDIFGWNLPFAADCLSPSLLALMREANVLQQDGTLYRSTVRISSIGDDLFLHSGFPTSQDDAVFFGPDTYRFARFIEQALVDAMPCKPGLRVLDIGCGSGAGGIIVARTLARCAMDASDTTDAAPSPALVMNDINAHALRLTAVNAAQAALPITIAAGDALSCVEGEFDLIISNPPYMDDEAQRAYRHGGARLGLALSVRIAGQALTRLAPGGRLMLYTGVAILDGRDPFLAELLPLLATAGCEWSYGEIDPDIFSEELDHPQYARAERIAAVGLVATRKMQAG